MFLSYFTIIDLVTLRFCLACKYLFNMHLVFSVYFKKSEMYTVLQQGGGFLRLGVAFPTPCW